MQIIVLFLFISLTFFLYSILNLKGNKNTGILQRLNYIKNQNEDSMPEDEYSKSFKERVIKPENLLAQQEQEDGK